MLLFLGDWKSTKIIIFQNIDGQKCLFDWLFRPTTYCGTVKIRLEFILNKAQNSTLSLCRPELT